MNRRRFEFDPKNFSFGKVRVNAGRILLLVLAYLLVTLTIAVLVYGVFALFWRTDTERELRREIKMYERLYPSFAPKEELLRDGIANLQYKDNEIYEKAFHANAPGTDPMSNLDFMFSADSVPDAKIANYTRDKADRLLAVSRDVDEAFGRIFRSLAAKDFIMPPMTLPVKDISYSQVGASTGRKIDPFYKAYVYHEGLDFIVARGTPVYAAASGTVGAVSSSKKLGKTVELLHEGGYVTVYAHLESASVRSGQKVSAGQKIGTAGMSGKAFAPHLHYEIRRGEEFLNPVNYIFASVSPADYSNILYMSVNTKQSMD